MSPEYVEIISWRPGNLVLQEHNKMAVAEKNSVASSSKSPIGKRCSQLVSDRVRVKWCGLLENKNCRDKNVVNGANFLIDLKVPLYREITT